MQKFRDQDQILITPAKAAEYMLRLFITGAAPNSIRAITNIKLICENHLQGKYVLGIIDLYDRADLAEQEQVVAVPMLVIDFPLPGRKLIGDMSNKIKVLETLGLSL